MDVCFYTLTKEVSTSLVMYYLPELNKIYSAKPRAKHVLSVAHLHEW